MPPQTAPLTLIVATTPVRTSDSLTPRLGIGLNGTLPWPRIKADMSFFARVTSRPPHAGATNAMIMGRKTYDSVPANLRPLGKRISAVITRDESGAVREKVRRELEAKRGRDAAKAAAAAAEGKAKPVTEEPATDAIVSSSMEAALETLEASYGAQEKLGKVFVIGGGEIYATALQKGSGAVGRGVRIVMTRVERKGDEGYECDTFFPVDDNFTEENGWREASPGELSEWVGEEVTGEWRDEGEVSIRMVGYERLS
ncbi:hypothetical protein ASPWEDRAFT_176152 [Aspergillus wentii DTO 134E9]|uniref:Dihydrofolate reductase n=1 Tax=Aspergillus wentii DTO 134E9 TaxID=1073089 RepID=A0A1L9R832_ASPWE|nr:uncharacterized protein ASPWEDRAFT_176152 [Aspergillus wentii DTO 134E9]KAI9927670.1 dihydrofolate reductase [Aspergillus wentii]OJJ31048.1 hypothetical protein ASPWEDRAFT_176152 [Aspergillus wentii DTO 134E9]